MRGPNPISRNPICLVTITRAFVGAGDVEQRTKTMETPDVFRANFRSTASELVEASIRFPKIKTTGGELE